MSKKISGAEYPLSKIFNSNFDYVIPSYQRPYAWAVDRRLSCLATYVWTPSVVDQRQKNLLEVLIDRWEVA